MLMKPCPRCKRLIPHGQTYCDACAPIAKAQAAEARERKAEYRKKKYNAKYNSRRDPKYLTFYRSKEWRITSRAYLQAAGYKCEAGLEGCQHIAAEVHHKQAIQTDEGWDRRLEWDNLEALCTSCHNRRHMRLRKTDDGTIDLRKIEAELKNKDPNPGGSLNSAHLVEENDHRRHSL